jgi:hypothetical protein
VITANVHASTRKINWTNICTGWDSKEHSKKMQISSIETAAPQSPFGRKSRQMCPNVFIESGKY